MRKRLRIPLDDVLAALERLADARSPRRALCLMIVALVAIWFIYVPIHELLHVAGCVLPGGSVDRLDLAPQYGAVILAKWFPFIQSGGEYAGRVSGFDTQGSDWIYLSTCFAPYLLSIIPGVALIRLSTRKTRPIVLGMGVVIGLAPFYNLIGDYYEMGSIITTRAVTVLAGVDNDPNGTSDMDLDDDDEPLDEATSIVSNHNGARYAGIRSDDVFTLIGKLVSEPKKLGLVDRSTQVKAAGLVVISGIVAVILAFVTYLLGDLPARLLVGPSESVRVKP